MHVGNARYLTESDLPETLGVFPLSGVLLLSGGRVAKETRRWIARILSAQEPDGRWRVPPHPYPTTLNELHTTLVSLWALDEYSQILAARGAGKLPPATP